MFCWPISVYPYLISAIVNMVLNMSENGNATWIECDHQSIVDTENPFVELENIDYRISFDY